MSKGLALIFVGLAGIFWASSGVAVQDFFLYSSKSPMELTNIRMCIAGAILIALSARRKSFWLSFEFLKRHPRFWLDVVIYGIVGVVFMQFTYFQGISIGGAAATTVMCYACPAMVVLWESLYHRKFPKRGEVIAVVLAMTGVFLLVTGGNPTKMLVPLGCVVWSLLSGAAFAFSAIFPKHLFAKKIDPYFLTGVGMFVGGLFTFALIDDKNWLPFLAPDVLFDVSWIIIFGTVCAFLSFNAGLKFLTPEEASITATTEPAASVVISRIIFGTAFGFVESIGIVLVLLAIVMPSIIKK
ncbi:MAG: EamA family transporter [Selenomonadaceae bacterium]|nr:EamA family transporter [Selenomonadaceae bacterium]